jgi:16S rRNA (guanine966-N2)-methyltransferase
MRITGGHLRGRKLPHQMGGSVRPTSDRVREALFSILGEDLSGCKVLDVYGGSGVLSLEALSRGAETALLFDRDSRSIRQCRTLAVSLGLGRQLEIRRGIVPACLPTEGRFDLIFVDPPYSQDAGPVLTRLAPLLAGVLVVEHQGEVPECEHLECVDQRQYGGTKLSFFRQSRGRETVVGLSEENAENPE